jgi:hypothetical protein
MDWLHFVGRTYYEIPDFEVEALTYGVSRRVSIPMLTAMNWGDRIWLAQGDMKKKTRVQNPLGSILFGSFRVTQLGGLLLNTIEDLPKSFCVKQVKKERRVVNRKCGLYMVDSDYDVSASLPALAEHFKDSSDDVGKLLLQGAYEPLDPQALLPDVFFRWGYRRFNSQRFYEAYSHKIEEWKRLDLPLEYLLIPVPGEFKDVTNIPKKSQPPKAMLQCVERYIQWEFFDNPYAKKVN